MCAPPAQVAGLIQPKPIHTPLVGLPTAYPVIKLANHQPVSINLLIETDVRGAVTHTSVGHTKHGLGEIRSILEHYVAKWRFEPALFEGQPVPSTYAIALQAKLDVSAVIPEETEELSPDLVQALVLAGRVPLSVQCVDGSGDVHPCAELPLLAGR